MLGTWKEEYDRTKGEQGMVKSVKALVSTEMRIGLDGYKVVREYWGEARKEAGKKSNEVSFVRE